MDQDTTEAPRPPHTSSEQQQVNRACESCRSLKVRCLPSADLSSDRCQRCRKAGRACRYAPPQKRRPRQRTDTRVAELEKEVRAMRSLLNRGTNSAHKKLSENNEKGDTDGTNCDSEEFTFPNADLERSLEKRPEELDLTTLPDNITYSSAVDVLSQTSHPDSNNAHPEAPTEPLDVVDRGLLSIETATELFDTYVINLVEHSPIVAFQPGQPASEIRRTKPVLFLAVITATAGKTDSKLYEILHAEVLRVYADRIIINCQKSIELVESMLITAVWHYPPEGCKELKFYQYIHMAATMALDIGLGGTTGLKGVSIPLPSKQSNQGDEYSFSFSNADGIQGDMPTLSPTAIDELTESRRTFLSCYLLCSGVAMALRRPSMLRFSSSCGDSIDFLEKSSAAVPSDALLIASVKLQHIADECGSSFAFDDPNTHVNLSDPRMQLTLKGFETRLEEWKKSLGRGLMNKSLAINFYQISIFLHEYAIHDIEPTDYVPPFLLNMLTQKPKPLSMASINACMSCIDSAHLLLDAFLNMDTTELQNIPVIIYVRMAYATVLLIKISISTTVPTSEIGNILDLETLKVDFYLTSLRTRIKQAAGLKKFKIPFKFLRIVGRLSMWYYSHHAARNQNRDQGQQELLWPLSTLAVDNEGSKGGGSFTQPAMVSTTEGARALPRTRENLSENYGRDNFTSDPKSALPVDKIPPQYATTSQMHSLEMDNQLTPETTRTGFTLSIEPLQSNTENVEGQWHALNQGFLPSFLPTDMNVDFFSVYNDMEASPSDLHPWLLNNNRTGSMDIENPGQNWDFGLG